MRAGEAAETLFSILRSGQVEAVDEGPPEVLVRVLRRGDVVGELALLSRATRSASVRARCDLDLLVLERAAFEDLIQRSPTFALALTRSLGAQLAASRSPVTAAQAPTTIAALDIDGSGHASPVAEMLANELERFGSVARLAAGDLASIDQAERDADRTVLSCGEEAGPA